MRFDHSILVLRKLTQEDCFVFEAFLGYLESLNILQLPSYRLT